MPPSVEATIVTRLLLDPPAWKDRVPGDVAAFLNVEALDFLARLPVCLVTRTSHTRALSRILDGAANLTPPFPSGSL